MIQKYKQLHNYFIDKDNSRFWITKPFNVGNKTVSTDSYILIATPKVDEYEDNTEKIKHVYPMDKTMDAQFNTKSLKEKLATIPLVDSYKEIETECKACDRYGQVDYIFTYDKEDHILEGECPICFGDGYLIDEVPDGKKELDYSKFMKIGISCFNLHLIEGLIYIAETIGEDTIYILSQKYENMASLFKIGEVEAVLMPIHIQGDDISRIIHF